MSYCDFCALSPADCRSRPVELVTDAELASKPYRYDVRRTLRSLGINHMQMRDVLANCFRDTDCATVLYEGMEVEFTLALFEFDTFPWWVRDLCRLPPDETITRNRMERREEFRTLATLLKILFPAESAMWGKRTVAYHDPSVEQRTLH